MKLTTKLGIFCGVLLFGGALIFLMTDSSVTCIEPPILRKGARPHTTFQYQIMRAPSPEIAACIDRGFSAWQIALADSTQLQFHRRTGTNPVHINVLFADVPDRDDVAGATLSPQYDADGYVTGFGIIISKNPALVSTCDGYYKVILHEIGHGLGLGHPFGTNGTSVMNMLHDANDIGGNVAQAPTVCDVEQTVAAIQ